MLHTRDFTKGIKFPGDFVMTSLDQELEDEHVAHLPHSLRTDLSHLDLTEADKIQDMNSKPNSTLVKIRLRAPK